MNKDLERLIKYIRKEDVALFIGSGFSLKAGAPKVWDIIEAILREGGQSFREGLDDSIRNSLRLLSEAYVKECGSRNDLMVLLRDLFNFDPTDCSNQQTLTKIPHIKQIFTTNYDTLIEDAYPRSERIVVTSNEGCAYTDEHKTKIYKIHGDITTLNDSASIIITDSDYKGYFKNRHFNLIWEELKQAFIKKHVVFVGYSLEDDNILDIIKTVRKSIGKSMKNMFLISPKISDAKVGQLEKNDVAYIKATAEEVLGNILRKLKENIIDDYKHKNVSQETYEAFLTRNAGLYTTVTHLEDENRIDRIEVAAGIKREDKVSFSVSEEIKNAITSKMFNSDIILNGTNVHIPALKIPVAEMGLFSHSINGIRFNGKDNISSLIVAPSVDKISVSVKMKSIGFKETLMGYRHQEAEAVLIDIETPICILTISIDKGVSKMNFTINSKEFYTNSTDAIKWINFIIGSFSGETFLINGISLKTNVIQENGILELKKVKMYYETIRCIELEEDIDFEVYENYSPENLYNALCVYHYLTKTGFKKELPKNATITFEIDSRDPHNLPIEKFDKDEFVMVQCTPLGNVELNKEIFNIPFCTTLFTNCKAEEVAKIDEYNYKVVMKDQSPNCMVWCSDTRPQQEGNVLRLSNNRIA